MTHLESFDLYEYRTAPRPVTTDGHTWSAGGSLIAALTGMHSTFVSRHQRDGALVAGCMRPDPDAAISFLLGGYPELPLAVDAGPGGLHGLLYPPGSAGMRLEQGRARETLGRLPAWLVCAGRSDPLRTSTSTPHRPSGSFEDCIAFLGKLPFAWIVVAAPLRRDQLDEEMSRLQADLPIAMARATSARERVGAQRLEERYRELARSTGAGVWSVRIVVGAGSNAAAERVAGLLCGASDIAGLPYALEPEAEARSLDDALGYSGAVGEAAVPFVATSELLAAITRPPARELPGIRLTLAHRFDVTPEGSTRPGVVEIGEILDASLRGAGALPVPRETLNRHTFVCGATGSGKSQTVRSLLENLSRSGAPVPWFVIEPAKAEYAGMAGRLGGAGTVTVIRPGDPDLVPASINPLEPEKGFPLQTHVDLVRALFIAAFEAQEPFPQVLSLALSRCYEDLGWDLVTGRPYHPTKPKFRTDELDAPYRPRYPTLADLQRVAREVIEEIGYGKEITADVQGFIEVRLGSLRVGTPGRFFEGGHPLDFERVLSSNVVFEIERLANDQDKAFLIGVVLIRLIEHLRVRRATLGGEGPLQHLTIIEEAHRLLKNVPIGSPARSSVELFASILAEIRAYGEGVVVAEQIPTKILADVVKNSALKIMHRLPAADDRALVGATMNLSPEQSAYVVAADPGLAAVTMDGMDFPLLVRMPAGGGERETPAGATYMPPIGARRSRLCGRECLDRPCTLAEMRSAELLSVRASVVLWIEFIAAAHVMGVESPAPRKPLRERLMASPARELECQLAYAVDRSVEARRPSLSRLYAPEDFGVHLLDVAVGQLVSPPTVSCSVYEDARWQAGPYRWVDVQGDLERAGSAAPKVDFALLRLRGLHLEGDDPAGWLATIYARGEYSVPEGEVLVGDPRVSGLADALDELAGGRDVGGVAHSVLDGEDTGLIARRIVGVMFERSEEE